MGVSKAVRQDSWGWRRVAAGRGPDRCRLSASLYNVRQRTRGNRAGAIPHIGTRSPVRSEEHTSELQSLMRISYAVFCLKKKKKKKRDQHSINHNNPISRPHKNSKDCTHTIRHTRTR